MNEKSLTSAMEGTTVVAVKNTFISDRSIDTCKSNLISELKGTNAAFTEFSEGVREFNFDATEYFGLLNMDTCPVGSTKTYREMENAERKRFKEEENRLAEESPNKEAFQKAKDRTQVILAIAGIRLLAHDAAQLGQQGLVYGKKVVGDAADKYVDIKEFLDRIFHNVTSKISLEEAKVIKRILPNGKAVIDVSSLPGSKGIDISRRLTPDEMRSLTDEYGVEFALVYQRGSGFNGGGGQYKLFSGVNNRVEVPIDKNSILVYHTHPAGSPWASNGDRKVLEMLQNAGSPQKSSQIIPSGSDDVTRFDIDGTPSEWPR